MICRTVPNEIGAEALEVNMKRVLTLSFCSLLACGGGEEAPTPAAAAPNAPAATAAAAAPGALASASQALATLGGTVMAAGQKLVEVLPLADGSIRATLMDAQGALVVDPAATVTVQVQGNDGSQHPVALAWDAEAGVYTGSVGADVTIQPGPIEVVVASGGEAVTARAARVSVAPVAAHGGTVMVAGDRGAEVRVGTDGKVEAWVAGEDGAFLDAADEGASVTVQVGPQGTPTQPVTLTWSTEAGHYVGRAQGVTLTETMPIQLSVARGQARGLTRVAEVRVMQAARGHGVGAIQAGATADGKPPTVDIGMAAVRVNVGGVRAPGLNVRVMGGAATTQQGGSVHVQVGVPRPPSATVSVMAAAPGVSVMAAAPAASVMAAAPAASAMASVMAPGVSVMGGGGLQISAMGGLHIGQ